MRREYGSWLRGSSPRARGTRATCRRSCGRGARGRNRFIPAGAGNTIPVPPCRDPTTVHPRGRGEHVFASATKTSTTGSSPRARGTPASCSPSCRRSRFIPAGAGNTNRSPTQEATKTVHPRGRGEHPEAVRNLDGADGSSPRARGTLIAPAIHRELERFIPAGAGNTSALQTRNRSPSVHPRGRGEHAQPN